MDDAQTASGVLKLIRDKGTLAEIRHYLAQSPATDNYDNISRQNQQNRSKFMDINRLSDIPIFEVPAKPWTSTTADDDFASHLISLYFTWQHSISYYLDRDLFLRDMCSKDLSSHFCSPLLVNSILAVACFYSDYDEAFVVPNVISSRGEHFFEEAISLLRKENGELSLPSLQARGNLYTWACGMGREKLALQQLTEMAACISQVTESRETLIEEANHEGQEMARVIDIAICGLFSLNSHATLRLEKPSMIKGLLYENFPQIQFSTGPWIPYPRQADPVPVHSYHVTRAMFDLAVILRDCSNYLFREAKPTCSDLTKIDSLYARLQQWAEDNSESIDNAEVPAFIEMGWVEASTPDSERDIQKRFKSLLVFAGWGIRTILNQYRSLWSVKFMSVESTHYAVVALFALLENLQDENNIKAFEDVLVSLRTFAHRWPFAKEAYQLMQLVAAQKAKLPPSTRILLSENDIKHAEHAQQLSNF
ncbi:uncharacterized protein N7503_006552 [Penicillium pulvis]|uniref:uncharacterized protein n=1 Tax=Penicillium pulvis TaxID=1562058 RepID=UPI0025466188|nr:uncharacterized protein N7503_006552 [Penicillium pulvis]KAJ5799047.1 hypothetical protein N7503_006552 [Penicillium pulvis]